MIKIKHMTINGIGGKVHYWISRPNNNSKGALVFTHGLTANHTMYERQVEYFKNDYVVITWDVPLHGLSMGYSNVPYLVADKPIKQAVVELGTIAFQISMIFSSFFREISRKGILISKMDFC